MNLKAISTPEYRQVEMKRTILSATDDTGRLRVIGEGIGNFAQATRAMSGEDYADLTQSRFQAKPS
jgi:hypothetical protein